MVLMGMWVLHRRTSSKKLAYFKNVIVHDRIWVKMLFSFLSFPTHGLELGIEGVGVAPCIYFLGVHCGVICQCFCAALDQCDRDIFQMGHLTLLLRASLWEVVSMVLFMLSACNFVDLPL